MTAATVAIPSLRQGDGQIVEIPMQASLKVLAGWAVCIGNPAQGSGVSGHAKELLAADSATHVFIGTAENDADNTSGAAAAINVKVRVDEHVQRYVGSGFTADDIGKRFFLSDNQTGQLAALAAGFRAGQVTEFVDSTHVFVKVAGAMAAGVGTGTARNRSELLGIIHTTALEGTAAIDLFKRTMRGNGRITRLWAKPTGFDASYAAGSQVLNLEIGTTNLTGGVLTLAFGDIDAVGDLANNIAATAITALNEFVDGDIVTCELAVSGTGFTAAIDNVSFEIWADIEYD